MGSERLTIGSGCCQSPKPSCQVSLSAVLQFPGPILSHSSSFSWLTSAQHKLRVVTCGLNTCNSPVIQLILFLHACLTLDMLLRLTSSWQHLADQMTWLPPNVIMVYSLILGGARKINTDSKAHSEVEMRKPAVISGCAIINPVKNCNGSKIWQHHPLLCTCTAMTMVSLKGAYDCLKYLLLM